MRGSTLRTAMVGVALALIALAASAIRPPISQAAVPCDPSLNLVGNPGFETGGLAPWVVLGANPPPTVSSANANTGTDSALLGTLTGPEALGDSSIYQQVTVPAGTSELSFWYWPATVDSVTFDWQDVYVTNTSGTILATVMHTADNSKKWINKTFDMTPYIGQTVRIEFLVHSDGFGDDTSMYVDDVCLSPTPRTLTVSKTGSGSGSVSSSPAGINCGATCSAHFGDGASVTLTATADAGSSFAGWSGACSGAGSCSLTMNADSAVSAMFAANPPLPDTTIGKVRINQKKRAATFNFKSVGAATGFQCALLAKKSKQPKFKKCKSPKTYKGLKPGKYTFEVRALGAAGPDTTPAKKKFKIG